MRRAALFLTVVAGVLVAPATAASAHGADTPDATAYRTTVTGITPPQPGVSVRAVEAGARLELTNHTGRTVEVLGYSGEPYIEVRPDGTYQNVNSPATYLNATLAGDPAVPATADPTAPPSWRRVSPATTVRWHDQRMRWLSPGPPPAAATDPSRSHRLRDWAVPLREEARTFEIRGTLDWMPPPAAGLWWAGAALLAVGVSALASRRAWSVGPVALIAGTIVLSYGVLRMLDGLPFAPALFLAAAITLLAGVLPLRRRAPFFLALAGVVLAVFGGLTDVGVLRAAVVPIAGPSWYARLAVLAALGAGVGLTAAGVLRLRADALVPVQAAPA